MKPLIDSDPRVVGDYTLVGRLGAGGMGRVYLGRSPSGRWVAVKVVRAELADDEEFRSRFEREVAAARAVSGFYTAPVIDADPTADVPWLAAAYVEGPDLRTAVLQAGPLPPDAVRSLAAGLAEALGAIHRAGLVHRDLKPSNVLLAADGPRVIDFGIARALDAPALTRGELVGSVGFMSPEHLTRGEVGQPSDVFSLGSTLVFAATGVGPFGQDTPAVLLFRITSAGPDLTGVPPGLRPLIGRCLSKEPAERPTPREILAELAATGTAAPDRGWLPHSASELLLQSAPPPATAFPADPSSGVTPSSGSPAPSGTHSGGTPRPYPPAPAHQVASRPHTGTPRPWSGPPHYAAAPPYQPPYQAPAPPPPTDRTNLTLGVIAVVVALVVLLCGGLGAGYLVDLGDPEKLTSRPGAPSNSRTPTGDDGSGTPTAAPSSAAPSARPTLRPATPVSVIGPVWKAGEKTYTMAFPGWPFAFRVPASWGCMKGTVPSIPDANAWVCVDERDSLSRQRAHVMLRRCATTCTGDEQQAMNAAWFDDPDRAASRDATTTFVETLRNDKGLYTLDMSHYFASTPGGPLGWQVGVFVESPAATSATVHKIINDIRSQTP